MTAAHSIKRGVSLYSFQDEYFHRKLSLEDIIAVTAKLDIPGIEIIGDQMIPGYPNLTDAFVKQWHGWMDKYGRTPVCLDMFLDWNQYKGRVMTFDERVASITKDIINANKLGCTVIRVIHDVQPEIMEKLAPTAEKYNVKLALEIHAPHHLDTELEQRLIETFERVQSPFIGFTIDMGIYTRRIPRVSMDRARREGVNPVILDYVDEAYNNHIDNQTIMETVVKMGATQFEMPWINQAAHNIYVDPRRMLDYMKWIYHFHAKFQEMLPDYTEYSIPYDEIIPVLIEGGFSGYLDSEYEGNRHIQDVYEVDSVEQVRRQQMMLKRLLGED